MKIAILLALLGASSIANAVDCKIFYYQRGNVMKQQNPGAYRSLKNDVIYLNVSSSARAYGPVELIALNELTAENLITLKDSGKVCLKGTLTSISQDTYLAYDVIQAADDAKREHLKD